MGGTGYEVILAGLTAAFVAQALKTMFDLARSGRLNFRLMVESGNMPSSHSSSMTAMAVSVGLVSGFDSVVFAVAIGVALIVMYDAAGVRRAAGDMAGVLNQITEDLYTNHPDRFPVRMRELLGHTPNEVWVGALIGVATSYAFHYYLA